MASLDTIWVGRLLQTQLCEDRRLMGAMNQPHLPHVLWTVVCDYVCEDPRIVNAIIALVDDARVDHGISGTDRIFYSQRTFAGPGDDDHIETTLTYEDYHLVCSSDKYGEMTVFTHLLMLPRQCHGGRISECAELDEDDVKVRRHLYASI